MKVAGAIIAGGPAQPAGRRREAVPERRRARRSPSGSWRCCGAAFARVLVVANDPAPWAPLGVEVVPDRVAGAGPLGGIHAALDRGGRLRRGRLRGGRSAVRRAGAARGAARPRARGRRGGAARGAAESSRCAPAMRGRCCPPSTRACAPASWPSTRCWRGLAVDWIEGRGAGRAGSRRAQLLQRQHARGSRARRGAGRRSRPARAVTTRGGRSPLAVALLLVGRGPVLRRDDVSRRRSPVPGVRAPRAAPVRRRSCPTRTAASTTARCRWLVWWLLGRPGVGQRAVRGARARCCTRGAAALTGALAARARPAGRGRVRRGAS